MFHTIKISPWGEVLFKKNYIKFIKFINLDEHSTTETVPVNASVQTNSSLNTDNQQNKNENSATAENDVTKTESTTESNESSQSSTNESQAFDDSIRIRLKYLNDHCRLVEGKLHENIGIFKRYYYQLYYKINKEIIKKFCVINLGDILAPSYHQIKSFV